jgi:hypothetical protein
MSNAVAFLTIEELALRLGVTARRARALAASGRVEGAMKVGRDWLIPVAVRIAPGKRGPQAQAAATTTQLVLSERGQAQRSKRRRQQRFRKLGIRAPALARAATMFRLPRESLRFEEPELRADELL